MVVRGGILALGLCGVLLFAKFSMAQTNSAVPNEDIQTILKTCFECHGPQGISKIPSRPTIAGQKRNYIAQQLTAFLKAAKFRDQNFKAMPATPARQAPMMEHVVQNLDTATIVKVASAVSVLACRKDDAKLKTPPPPPTIAKSCAACHGVDGIGIQINTPNLAGQQRAYLRRELLLIREAAWGVKAKDSATARAHPIMERQVARLKIQDVDALAEYYSALDCRGRAVQRAVQ